MTVAALGRGAPGSRNVLVVDHGVGTIGTSTRYDCSHDKMTLLFGNTYATAVGDAMVIDALRSIIAWYDPKRPNLRDPATFDAILSGLERLRAIQIVNGQPVATDLLGTHLLICSRADAFYWQSEFDSATNKFTRPAAAKEVASGQAVLMWGHNTFWLVNNYGDGGQDPVASLVNTMLAFDADMQSKGYKLPYALDKRCSAVILPHKSSEPLKRVRPFKSLPEQWVKYRGGPAVELLEDADFATFPALKAT